MSFDVKTEYQKILMKLQDFADSQNGVRIYNNLITLDSANKDNANIVNINVVKDDNIGDFITKTKEVLSYFKTLLTNVNNNSIPQDISEIVKTDNLIQKYILVMAVFTHMRVLMLCYILLVQKRINLPVSQANASGRGVANAAASAPGRVNVEQGAQTGTQTSAGDNKQNINALLRALESVQNENDHLKQQLQQQGENKSDKSLELQQKDGIIKELQQQVQAAQNAQNTTNSNTLKNQVKDLEQQIASKLGVEAEAQVLKEKLKKLLEAACGGTNATLSRNSRTANGQSQGIVEERPTPGAINPACRISSKQITDSIDNDFKKILDHIQVQKDKIDQLTNLLKESIPIILKLDNGLNI